MSIPVTSFLQYLVRGGILSLVGRMGSLFSALVVSTLLTRLLPPEEVGRFFLVISVVTVAATCGQLGLPPIVVRLISSARANGNLSKARGVARYTLRLSFFGGVIAALFLVVGPGAWIMKLLGSHASQLLMVLLALLTSSKVIEGMIAEIFRGYKQVGRAALFSSLISNLLLIGGLLIFLLLERRGPEWHFRISDVVAMSVAAAALTALLGIVLVERDNQEFSRSGIPGGWSLLRSSAPILGASLLTIVWETAGIWILSSVTRDETQVALFRTAQYIGHLTLTPLMVANAVLMPIIAQLHTQRKRGHLTAILRLSATVTTLPALLASLFFIVFGEWLLGAVYGPYYRDAAHLLIILSLARVVAVWVGSCGLTLLMSGRQTTLFVAQAVSLGAFLTIGVVLTRAYGALGMATATFIAVLLQQLLKLAGARLQTGVWTCGTLSPRLLRSYWQALPSIQA